jgi:hypothetical protein
MIVEPVPAGRRTGRRRVLARLALMLPVVLLLVIVGAGFLGREAERRVPVVAALASQRPEPSTAPAPSSPKPFAVVTDPEPSQPPFPRSIDGLTVRSVPEALAGPAANASGDVVAIAGYLGVLDPPTDCADGFDPLGPLCERNVVIAEIQWSMTGGASFAELGPHVHVHVPVGIRLPADLVRTTPTMRESPLPAVVVGRFDGSPLPGCGTVKADCEIAFELDAVAWFEAGPYAAQPFVGQQIDAIPEDWILHNRSAVEALTVGPAGVPLSSALVRPETLATLDRAAARAVRRHPQPGLVWYVRGLRWADNGGGAKRRELVWAVIGDVSLKVIARGVIDDGAAR